MDSSHRFCALAIGRLVVVVSVPIVVQDLENLCFREWHVRRSSQALFEKNPGTVRLDAVMKSRSARLY